VCISYLPDGRKSPRAKTRPKSATATPIPSLVAKPIVLLSESEEIGAS